MVHAFNIPEILSLICEEAQLEPPDLARLLTTTRLFYHYAVPFVWRSLPDSAPIILAKLLPDDAACLKYGYDDTIAERLQPLDAQSLVRFNFYVPHVKQLARHCLNWPSNIMWDRLLKLVDRRPILPNLEILKVSLAVFGAGKLHDPAAYLSAHLTPKLIEIDLGPSDEYSSMEPQCLHGVVSTIAQKCPHIQSLDLSSVVCETEMDPTLENELVDSLNQLCHLRALKIGKAALESKVLSAISSLPNLKSLDLEQVDSPLFNLLETSLPCGSFPALQHLGMELGSINKPQNARAAWSIAAVAQRLMSISVRATGYCNPSQVRKLARTICRYGPFVTSLCLEYEHVRPANLFFSPALVDILAQLPLQRLCIWENDSPYKDRWDSERFALTFQNLEYLTITGYDFTFTDFKNIAQHIPRLQQLSASIETNKDWPSKHEVALLTLTPSPSQLCLYLAIVGFLLKIIPDDLCFEGIPSQKLEVIGAGLHTLWPKGLVCKAYQLPESLKKREPNYADKINATLKQLRKADGHGDETEVTLQDYARQCNPSWFESFNVE
ncbi:hypothetical protein B0J17DRAFT_707843 [Rhizoctonia solani]|nr:hypothetical protein B0J17DRAFT_707843 [Rhizoctonia solani]